MPYIISFILSIVFISVKFGSSSYYNGYANHYGDLRNSVGIKVISGDSDDYFKGIDKYGDSIIIGCSTEEDYDYGEDSDGEYKYIITVKVYDEYYQFLWKKNTYIYDERWPSSYDILDRIDGWKGITIEKKIGY